MDLAMCPECAKTGKESKLEYLLHDDVNLILCQDNDCSYNYKGHHVIRSREESQLSPHLLDRLCPGYIPVTILKEPRLKYRHLKMLLWLIEIKKINVYYWLQEEIGSMVYLRMKGKESLYQMTPSAKQMLELTNEEIEIGKHILPDLRKVVETLKIQYQIHIKRCS